MPVLVGELLSSLGRNLSFQTVSHKRAPMCVAIIILAIAESAIGFQSCKVCTCTLGLSWSEAVDKPVAYVVNRVQKFNEKTD